MRIIKKNNTKIVVYESQIEFFNQLEQPILRGRSNSSESSDEFFTGTKSYAESYSLLKNGDKESFMKMSKLAPTISKKFTLSKGKKIKQIEDVVGYQPIVAHAIMGLPNSMIRSDTQTHFNKVLSIYINSSIASYTSQDEITEAGLVLLGMIDQFERNGYRISLNMGMLYTIGQSKYSGYMANVKLASQPLNIMRTAYYIANPSFLRRTSFRIVETERNLEDVTHDGYGSNRYNESGESDLQSELGEHSVIIQLRDLVAEKSIDNQISYLESKFLGGKE